MVSIVIKFIKSPLSWAIGLIILSVVGIYQKLQIQGIISLDNMAYVYYNPVISEPTLASLKTLFLPYIYWMPLTWLTHMLDWAIFKDQFNAHLILNVILHAINSTLIFLITRQLIGANEKKDKAWPLFWALVSALIWSLHPLRVEVVAWIAERKELLMSTFFLGSVLAYLCTKKEGLSWPVIGLGVAAFASKPMAVSLPLVLCLMDLYPKQRVKLFQDKWPCYWRIIKEKWLLWMGSLWVIAATLYGQQKGIAEGGAQFDLISRIAGVFGRITFYIEKTIFPAKLVPFYPDFRPGLGDWQVWIGVLMVLFGLAYGMNRVRKSAGWLVIWSIFLLTLLPVLGVIQTGLVKVADRWTYLPTMVFYIAIGVCLARWTDKIGFKFKVGMAILLMSLVGILGRLSWHQINLWQNDVTFWTAVATRYPDQVPNAYVNLAVYYEQAGKDQAAKALVQRALKVDPDFYHAWVNLGDFERKEGQFDKALQYYLEAEKRYDQDFHLHEKIAQVHYQLGQYPLALKRLDQVADKIETSFGVPPKALFQRLLIFKASVLLKMGQVAPMKDIALFLVQENTSSAIPYYLLALYERDFGTLSQSKIWILQALEREENIAYRNFLSDIEQKMTEAVEKNK